MTAWAIFSKKICRRPHFTFVKKNCALKNLLFLLPLLSASLWAQTDSAAPDRPLNTMTVDELTEKTETLFSQGKYKDAVIVAQAMLEVARRDSGETSYAYGNSLDMLGVTLDHAERENEARGYLEAGVEHARKLSGIYSSDYVLRLSNLAMLYRDLGYNARALSGLQEAVLLGDSVLKDEQEYFGILINNLALVSEESGLLELAQKRYERALLITERAVGRNSTRYATRLNNLATLNYRQRRFQRAKELYTEAYKIQLAQAGPTHPFTLMSQSNIANAELNLLQFDSARVHLQALLPVLDQALSPTHFLSLCSSSQLGKALVSLGQYQEALRYLEPAAENLQELYTGKHVDLQGCMMFTMLAHEQLGNQAEMRRWALRLIAQKQREIQERVAQFSESEQLAEFTSNSLFQAHVMNSLQARHPADTVLAGANFNAELAYKGFILGNAQNLRRALSASRDTALQARFSEWQALKKQLAQGYSVAPARRSPGFEGMIQRAELLERNLAVQSSQFRMARRNVSWQEVQARLRPGEAAIEFDNYQQYSSKNTYDRSGPYWYMAWLIRAKGSGRGPGFDSPQPVFLFPTGKLANLRAIRELYRPGGTLQSLLWQPLEKALAEEKGEAIQTLYIAPSGLLNQVNFGAIPLPEAPGRSGQTLAERYTVHLLGSVRQLVDHDISTPSPAPANALVMGGVQYDADSLSLARSNMAQADHSTNYLLRSVHADTSANRGFIGENGWAFLPWTAREADAVNNALLKSGARAQLLKGAEASEGAFKKWAGQGNLIHLATHGYFFAEADSAAVSGFQASSNALVRSGLLLAGANRVWKGSDAPAGQEDGILTAYEIAQMDLHNVDLVVLSACETGLGELETYEGVYGLQRAFKMAGARYLLMSLWQVDDHATQEFMDAFYEAWLLRKLPIPEAYRQAQRSLRLKYSAPFSPSMWAGFILLE